MNTKRFAVLVGVLVVLLLSVGVMYAQGPGGDNGPGGRGGPGGKGGPRNGHLALIEEIASQTDTAVEDVIAARMDGQSFNDYVAEFDVDPADVIGAVVADAQEHLAEAVAEGNLTQDEADAKLAEIETRITEAMNSTEAFEQRPEGRPEQGQRDGQRGGHDFGAIDIISEATGLEPQEVMSAWQDGSTLAEIIEANGADVETIKADIIADATEKLNQAVADGRIDQAEADEKIASLDAKVDEVLSSEFEARPAGRDGRRGPGQGAGDNAGADAAE